MDERRARERVERRRRGRRRSRRRRRSCRGRRSGARVARSRTANTGATGVGAGAAAAGGCRAGRPARAAPASRAAPARRRPAARSRCAARRSSRPGQHRTSGSPGTRSSTSQSMPPSSPTATIAGYRHRGGSWPGERRLASEAGPMLPLTRITTSPRSQTSLVTLSTRVDADVGAAGEPGGDEGAPGAEFGQLRLFHLHPVWTTGAQPDDISASTASLKAGQASSAHWSKARSVSATQADAEPPGRPRGTSRSRRSGRRSAPSSPSRSSAATSPSRSSKPSPQSQGSMRPMPGTTPGEPRELHRRRLGERRRRRPASGRAARRRRRAGRRGSWAPAAGDPPSSVGGGQAERLQHRLAGRRRRTACRLRASTVGGGSLDAGVRVDAPGPGPGDRRLAVEGEARRVGEQVAQGRPWRPASSSRPTVPSSTATSTASVVSSFVTEARAPASLGVAGGRRVLPPDAFAARTTPAAAAGTGQVPGRSSASMRGRR